MQDQNLTNTMTASSPIGNGAGVTGVEMGIPNFTPPTSLDAAGAPAANATVPGVPAVAPTPAAPGADISTMGIPAVQPPTSDATTKPAQNVADNSKTQPADKPADKPKEAKAPSKVAQTDMVKKIIEKIRSSENILIALSNNPSVDDIAAAIGLTLYLDSIQRHVTAIYSGRITEGLEFLQPEATFETNTDSLQDFIIALSKDKADHLRYKLEGDYVKVFITPYRAKITEEDLKFSHGEYNVDFVIALDVASPDELDAALEEHGRIMHSASTVNITTSAPGKFGEIDWSNPTASSVCEMVTQLILEMQGDDKPLDKDVATALLTGIVASTDRFSNSRTNSDTLGLASKLMGMGADQQLISANISGNEISQEEPEAPNDNLTVEHASEELPDNTPTIVMPTVNTDISAVDPAVNPTSVPDMPIMRPIDQPGTTMLAQPTMSQPGNLGNTAPSSEQFGMNSTAPAMPMQNPAANLAGDMGAELGPEPAQMSIPSMVPQENMVPPMPPTDDRLAMSEAPGTEVPMPDASLMPPPVNGELADRPDSVLPPPPVPPVDEVLMAPPA